MSQNHPLSVFMHPCTFWYGRFSGITRYVCELTQALIDLNVDVRIPIRDTQNEYLLNAPFFAKTSAEALPAPWYIRAVHQLLKSTPLSEKARRFELRAQSVAYMKQKLPVDVLHPTHVNGYDQIPFIGRTPLVLTVHDMTHERYPSSFSSKDVTAQRKKDYVKRATRVIAISQKTKEDLVEICGVSPEKIDVIHHGNSLYLPSDYKNRHMDLPERYVLFVGKRYGYKNFNRFFESFVAVALQDKDLHLVCVGGGGFSPEERQLIQARHMENRVHLKHVTDDELAIAYNRCSAFVYPSEYEGFGLPLLEAFSCGAPVLCARASCFPEVAGTGADFFDPRDVDSMSGMLANVLNSSAYADELRHRGNLRMKDFSWNRCAAETLETYYKAIQQA